MLRQLLTAAALALTATAASAQCFNPDGLSGPCWQQAQANLPAFPPIQMPGTGICWDQCTPQPQVNTVVQLSAPNFVDCGQYDVGLTVLDGAGTNMLNGRVRLDYTRTWEEAAPNNQRLQVWRFVAKVDMMRGNGFDPCIVPPELGSIPTTFYYGYVDYAFNCATNQWESSVVLFHNCDEFIHQPGLSSTPGVYHPGRSYALVAPHTAVNPFIPGNLLPAAGPIVSEAVRNVPQIPGMPCITEERIAGGNVNLVGTGCGCQFAAAPNQLTARRFTGTGACTGPVGSSAFLSVNLSPTFPWFHMMTNSIGCWSTDFSYPGKECAWVDEGPMLYADGCGGGLFAEMQYGATTSEGYDVVSTGGALASKNFTDMASNASYALPGPIAFPIVGDVRKSRHLIYVNVP